MKQLWSIALCWIVIASCNATKSFNNYKALFEASPVIEKYRNIDDVNNVYVELRENNFFQFYRVLYDSVKNTQYIGQYKQVGDTLHLEFFDKDGYKAIGRKAFLDRKNGEIIFFDKTLPARSRWTLF